MGPSSVLSSCTTWRYRRAAATASTGSASPASTWKPAPLRRTPQRAAGIAPDM
jgi:hypothetical protein